jgi:hypothetical protein
MNTEKIIDYIFKTIVVILLIVLIFIDKKETCISNNTFKDSVILIYKDTAVYFQKEIIKNHYEYKIDSVIISYMPDSLLFPEIMRKSREILQYSRFTETNINGTYKGTALPDGNRTIENATQNVRECNRHDSGYKNSSER